MGKAALAAAGLSQLPESRSSFARLSSIIFIREKEVTCVAIFPCYESGKALPARSEQFKGVGIFIIFSMRFGILRLLSFVRRRPVDLSCPRPLV